MEKEITLYTAVIGAIFTGLAMLIPILATQYVTIKKLNLATKTSNEALGVANDVNAKIAFAMQSIQANSNTNMDNRQNADKRLGLLEDRNERNDRANNFKK